MSTIYKVSLGLTALATVACSLLAAVAWYKHFEWQRTGAYERNSFPMGSFAENTTWWAVGCLAVTAIAWSLAIRSKQST